MTAPAAVKPEVQEYRWVYAGLRAGAKGPVECWARLTPGGALDEEFLYAAQKKTRTVGGIYAFASAEDGNAARVVAARFTGDSWEDKLKVSEWKGLHEATRVAGSLKQAEAKLKAEDLAALDGLRRAYQRASFTGQLGIELMVLRYLRRGA